MSPASPFLKTAWSRARLTALKVQMRQQAHVMRMSSVIQAPLLIMWVTVRMWSMKFTRIDQLKWSSWPEVEPDLNSECELECELVECELETHQCDANAGGLNSFGSYRCLYVRRFVETNNEFKNWLTVFISCYLALVFVIRMLLVFILQASSNVSAKMDDT